MTRTRNNLHGLVLATLLITMLIYSLAQCRAHAAGTIALRWDSVPNATGYVLYAGYRGTGDYHVNNYEGLNMSSQLSIVLTSSDCTNYWLALKSYDSSGNLSIDYSDEVVGWARPEVDEFTALTTPFFNHAPGIHTLRIAGSNFRDGAAVQSDDTELVVISTNVIDCYNIDMTYSIGAVPVSVRLEVVNDDDTYSVAIAPLLLQSAYPGVVFGFGRTDAYVPTP